MKILVTGSSGFIGFHLVNKILEKYNIDTVFGIDNMNSYYDKSLKLDRTNILIDKYKSKYVFICEDICDYNKIDSIVEQSDVVVNLAAQAGVRHSFLKPYEYIHSNIDGFFNVLDACRRHKKKLVYASSSSVYGKNKIPWSEDQIVDTPLSLYASTKISNEIISNSYFNMYNYMDITGLRFFTVWGTFGRPDMSIWLWTKAILNNEPIKLFNYGNHHRDYTHIDDITDGVISSIFKDYEPSAKIYNLGNNKSIKIEEVISLISTYTNIKPIIEYLPIQPGDVEKTYANIDKANKDLGFEPKISVENNIGEFIDWYKNYRIQ